MELKKQSRFSADKLRQFTLLFVLLLLVVLFSVLSPYFLQESNLMNIMRQVSTNAICAVAMTMIIILGDIDLSVGSMLAFLSVIGAKVYNALSGGLPAAMAALVVVMLVGAAIGGFSGIVTAKGKVPAFVTTLALMEALRGLGYIITGGSPIPISDKEFKVFGSGWLGIIPVPVVLMILVLIAGVFVMKATHFGRHLYAIGGNAQASHWSGLNVVRTRIVVFIIAGALYGLAAMILAGRLGGGYPATGTGAEMDAITATILGGTSMSGGKGSVLGTLIGVLIIGVINVGLTLLDVSTFWQQVLMGAIILVAVLLDTKSKSKG